MNSAPSGPITPGSCISSDCVCFSGLFRAANIYFLFLALLNWVPVVEAFEKEITMIPLLVVLVVIGIKDALEDYRRYLFDKKVNNYVVQVFCGSVSLKGHFL